ncbi:hypothetical protein C8R46DRAFT_1146707 [Mycena filopes]|nr:hypothetical protein C8R46DRAFT_1146707 [Mycena filopes]
MLFLLDVLDNLPRLRISSSLMRVILWMLKEAGCKGVPSFDRLRKLQKELRAQCGIPSIPCKSAQGNVFFMNDPRAIVAKDWTNPTTRNLIHVYPEIPEDGVIREIWHAQKWRKNMDLDILSPMYNAGASHYYVNEVARLRSGDFVVPVRWVKFRNKVYADALFVTFNEMGEGLINDETTLICSDELMQNYYDLEHAHKVPKWAETTVKAGYPSRMPNPKRIVAAGRPFYSSFVDYFSDDVSGNRSKSWNKHWNAYMTHRNLPRRVLQQEFHVHFVSTSPHASVSEQFYEFKEAVEATHSDPVEVQDELGNTSCFSLYVNNGPSDNPMQSEIAAHIGGKGNCFCRKCQVGGTQKEKATNEGYQALFEAGLPRTKEHILQELEKQVQLACSGVMKHVKDSQTATGVKDVYTQFYIDDLISRFKQMRKDEPDRAVEDIEKELIQWTIDNRDRIYSPFLKLKGFDPAKDTPIELLHTILLGIVKYIWHITHTPWSSDQKKMYAMRLQSTSTDGLSIHAIRSSYIMQYAGSLIGRQFKTIAQTNLFHIRGLVSDDHFKAWRATGELAALLWFPEIRNLGEYRRDLKVAVANVLDIFGTIDPSKILSKIKYHLLVHTDEDVVEIGPLVGAITEIYEAYNAVFRWCSVLSNHLAPSRDIARQLADQEGLKQRLTGGMWRGANQEWEQGGSGVRSFLAAHPILQRLIGWTEPKRVAAGDSKLAALKRGQKERTTYMLHSTVATRALNYGEYRADSEWMKGQYVVSESLDECLVGSWVFAVSPFARGSTISGRILDILVSANGEALVIVEQFQVLSSRDEIYGMPVLVRKDSEEIFSIVAGKDLKFKFNVQHDCGSAECDTDGTRLRIQERVESDQIENFVVHKPLDRFFINSHAFHNAHLLRATLPRDLLAPIPLFPDRQEQHHELAAKLRAAHISQAAKRAEKKRKRLEQDSGADTDADELETRPRKKSKRTTAPRQGRKAQGGQGRRTRATRGPAGGDGESMVASRGKRTITRTRRALATPEPDTDDTDGGSGSEELFDPSDSEYDEE